ncbi:DUF2846 domain-containing protein [Pantoea sp. BIGb0393]|uniref:DUF2846 domain-containing protein n=1 Tax=Pantoea nemavictus TaxID=2726955 RepID=A0ABU8PYG8_9GAMM|nr:DUF2846 domain-containing protein [Pantoea nemavictus]MBA0038760.1 DUF2846 domain-containing protein [Pantoea nemavictus]
MPAAKRLVIGSLLFAAVVPSVIASTVSTNPFGEAYRKHQPVTQALSQVVFYRQNALVTASGGANIYINGKMHTSLLPGGYTSFCVQPGTHHLGVRLGRFLPATGEDKSQFVTTMKPGRTYFLRVDEHTLMHEPPKSVKSALGEDELKQTRRQAHLLSRATSALPCAFDYALTQPRVDYLLPSQSLFLSDTTLSQQGREAIADLVVQIRQDHAWINQLQVNMVDPGSTRPAQQQREAQFRQALIDAAISPDSITFVRNALPQQNVFVLQVN